MVTEKEKVLVKFIEDWQEIKFKGDINDPKQVHKFLYDHAMDINDYFLCYIQ